MNKKLHIFTALLSLTALLVSIFTLKKIEGFQNEQCVQTKFLNIILDRVRACVAHNEEISARQEIFDLLNVLESKGTFSEVGSDDLRVKYVTSQGTIEHVLACAMVLGDIDHLVGVIHTPTPATPLCTPVENLDKELLDSSIRYNLEKLLTVRSRAIIVREYLENGGKLFIAYPKGGLEKRTTQQQQVYKQALERYVGRLFDAVLSCNSMDPSKVGATYFFRNNAGELFAFSIKSQQANDPKELSEWAIWIGKVTDPEMGNRVNEILNYLKACDGPDLRAELV